MLDIFKKKASFEALGMRADFHCHVLPGVDDGSGNVEDSLRMLRMMAEMGIREVVLTPHINPEVYPETDERLVRERFEEFKGMMPQDIRSEVRLTLGAEYMVINGFEERDVAQLIQFVPGKVLIEMSYLYPSKNIEHAIFSLMMAGVTPVIAHPERYLYYADKIGTFERLHDMGAEFQMNALSLSGIYGKGSLRILSQLLENGWYTYIGTDAHSTQHLDNVRRARFDKRFAGESAAVHERSIATLGV